ncbi:hypothetical protein DEI93_02385 [Curtobacterium sp. MCBD17_035]|uniref:hypothetical protein n=1 Tax=Curtobacterium sp. MCBD17_035 TaxID=2175673 RepID=UPI000DA8F830|nr:hypothetical protein [Curtobacterium sp. MCBD17_035]WIB67909.1 hypothetical protein DEI93_02385 [Curtobacterium sp. MCBD17_035]
MLELIRVDVRTPPDVARSLQRAALPAQPGGTAREPTLVRLLRGTYVHRDAWERLDERGRHLVRIAAVAPTLGERRIVAHCSAAAVHDWSVLGGWPDRVALTEPDRVRSETRRRSVVLHPTTSTDSIAVTVLGHLVRASSPTVTAADLARTMAFRSSVIVLDQALRRGLDRRSVLALVDCAGPRGAARATRAIAFADARAESVGESLMRVVLHELGAPTPVLQHEFRSPRGSLARVDFWFPDQGVVLEFDGEGKYRDPALRGGRSAEQVVIDEKYREDWVRALPEVRAVRRVRWAELFRRHDLARKLLGAGLPLRP